MARRSKRHSRQARARTPRGPRIVVGAPSLRRWLGEVGMKQQTESGAKCCSSPQLTFREAPRAVTWRSPQLLAASSESSWCEEASALLLEPQGDRSDGRQAINREIDGSAPIERQMATTIQQTRDTGEGVSRYAGAVGYDRQH